VNTSMKDAACIKEHAKGMAMMTFYDNKETWRYIKWGEIIINDVDGSSDTEMCSFELNDNASKGKKLIWGPEGKITWRNAGLCCKLWLVFVV
jgi:hypothetical protein